MLNSTALTRVQSIFLIAVIVIGALGASLAYTMIGEEHSSSDVIKIGVCADLDMLFGKSTYQGVQLAAEQINSQGGILGKTIKVIAEDSDANAAFPDPISGTKALTKLLSVHKVDYIITSDSPFILAYQDIIADHEKIMFLTAGISNEFTQRVEDNYDRYKFFFRTSPNATHALFGTSDCVNVLRNYSSFNKIAILTEDVESWVNFMPVISSQLSNINGFDVVYQNKFPTGTIDFSSYLNTIENAGAEILLPLISSQDGIILIKDWYERAAPFVIWGFLGYIGDPNAWDYTDGRCEAVTSTALATAAGYPLTSETVPFRDAYIERWGDIPHSVAAYSYDTLRFILFDALQRAQTTETNSVIEALENTEVETTLARNFVFTNSHDTMGGENINNPEEDFMVVTLFQWQNGVQVPVYPQKILEETGASYMFPDWSGPWNNIS